MNDTKCTGPGSEGCVVNTLNLTTTKFYLSIIVALFAIVGAVYAATAHLVNYQVRQEMTPIIEDCVHREVKTELQEQKTTMERELGSIRVDLAQIRTISERNQQLLSRLLTRELNPDKKME